MCLVKYKWIGTNNFTKTKQQCSSVDVLYRSNTQPLLETIVESTRSSHYTLDESNTYIAKVSSKETHVLYTTVHENIGGELNAEQSITLKETQKCKIVSATTLHEAIVEIGDAITQETLITEYFYPQEEAKLFTNAVNNFWSYLQPKSLGSLQSAKAFVHLVRLAKRSSKEDISKALGSKKNQPLL